LDLEALGQLAPLSANNHLPSVGTTVGLVKSNFFSSNVQLVVKRNHIWCKHPFTGGGAMLRWRALAS